MQGILGLNITNKNEELVDIAGNIYVKTPRALKSLLRGLRNIGYEIKNLRKEKSSLSDASVEHKEKNGWSLWYASLPDIRAGRCGSCGGLISVYGIHSHNHKCELCGATTYAEIRDGSTVRFCFIDEGNSGGMADIKFRAKYWDSEAGHLYLYPTVLDGNWRHGERALQYLEEHKDKWERVTRFGHPYIRITYKKYGEYAEGERVIDMTDILDHYHNHRIVKIWKGVEVDDMFGKLPIPQSINIYESWHWAPLEKSPKLHERIMHAAGQVSRKDYYYQDGRPALYDVAWKNMAMFVRHFTELDADAFDRTWPKFRKDGPGGIEDLARFCSDKPQIENRPNIGNLLFAFSGGFRLEDMSEDELEAIEIALADRPTRDEFMDFIQVLGGK